jgi:hypothetical protein
VTTSRYLAFGLLFGFLLARVGATDYDAISGMFQLTYLHLMGVIGLAVALNAIGFLLLRRRGVRARSGEALALAPKPMTRGLLAGSLLFGVGWALSGSCPGTTLSMIGQGKLAGLVIFAGILAQGLSHLVNRVRSAPRRDADQPSGDGGCDRVAFAPVAPRAATGERCRLLEQPPASGYARLSAAHFL